MDGPNSEEIEKMRRKQDTPSTNMIFLEELCLAEDANSSDDQRGSTDRGRKNMIKDRQNHKPPHKSLKKG
jgi:hypothetical protein